MVRFAEIRQFSDFVTAFSRNLLTICPRSEIFASFDWMESVSLLFDYCDGSWKVLEHKFSF